MARITPQVKAEAEAEAGANVRAEAEAEARAESEAAVEVLISLYNLATDCLRISTYFFHPIQQCAQQVYHTAVPLSPTSTQLHESCLQSVIDNQLSCVVAFSGAPDTWGSLLGAIDIRPRQLTCITTSLQRIVVACEDTVNIYSAVTFMLQQSLHTPETVTKIQDLPDGSLLLFAHSFSVTMWDIQTGGLIHTFTVQCKVNDIAVSTTHIACSSSDGSITFWNTHTKKMTKTSGKNQSVVSIHWLASLELAVITQNSIYIHHPTIGTLQSLTIPSQAWGAIYLADRSEFLVGVLQPGKESNRDCCYFVSVKYKYRLLSRWVVAGPKITKQLKHPTLIGKEIVCITSPSGVQSFSTTSHCWTNSSPLLNGATSVAVSLNRNIVVQTKDTIKIFPVDILMSGTDHKDVRQSHIYPLGKNHIICIQPTRHLTLLKLETLQELHPDNSTFSLWSLLVNLLPITSVQLSITHLPSSHGLSTWFDIMLVLQVWQSGTPLPEQTEMDEGGVLLSGLSPQCTRVVTIHNSPQLEICVKDTKSGVILANLPLEQNELGMGKVYDIIFDSETRFYLKIDGPGQYIQIPYHIVATPLASNPHTVSKGEPVPLSVPQTTPPYTLDANCQWVLDAKSRKVCWISPGYIHRGDGGHFWAGLSLVMVGDDGIVRKLTFKDPEY